MQYGVVYIDFVVCIDCVVGMRSAVGTKTVALRH